jgi:hypothetical protein
MKKPKYYDARACCPGDPVIGFASVQADGRIRLMLWCSPLANQVIELVPKADDE